MSAQPDPGCAAVKLAVDLLVDLSTDQRLAVLSVLAGRDPQLVLDAIATVQERFGS